MATSLDELFRTRRAALEAEAAVLDARSEGALSARLRAAVGEARGLEDRSERSFRLQVLVDLIAKVEDREAFTLLVEVFDDPERAVRARAAAACAVVAVERWPELVRAIEEGIERGMSVAALLDVPGLLLDLADGDSQVPVDVLVRLVDHQDADVAAEAACALAELDVPGVRELLESFRGDQRPISDPGGVPSTLGALIEDLLATGELASALEDGS